jgi:TonB-linked SusC/RagA family outer membrane protein
MKKTFMLVLILFWGGQLLFGQTKTITGKVLDESGLGIPGVNVYVKGTTNGTSTDIDGGFVLKTIGNETVLVFSFIGYINKEVNVGNRTSVNVTLEEDTQAIQEVIVVGFGSQKRENVTGATSYVKMDQLLGDRPIVSSAQALQGVAAGLQVVSTSGRPGATGTSLSIRGMASISGGGSPLVLVDNVPMSLEDINPRDIESVSVLKDAAASSIYGARAAFGVVLITTKKAKKNQPIKFNYSATASFSTPSELPEKATTREFVSALQDFGVYRYFSNQNVDQWDDFLNQHASDSNLYPDGYAVDESGIIYRLEDTDVIGDFLDNAGVAQVHNFSFSGGSEKISYRVAAGYSDEDGVLVTDNDSYKKYNINASLNSDLTSNLKSTTNIFYRSSKRTNPIGAYSSAIQYPMYTPSGFWEMENGDVLPFDTPTNLEKYKIPSTTNTDNIRMFQKLDFTPFKDFTISGEYTFQKGFTTTRSTNNQLKTVSYHKYTANASSPENTRYSRGYSDFKNHALNLYGKYDKSVGNHNFGLLAGFNKEQRINEGFSVYRKNLISVDVPGIDTGIGEQGGSDSYGDWSVMGYFGRLNYNFKEKYFIEANGRYDGSSRFAKGSRFGFFPSFSAGWNIAKEPFMESIVEQVSTLKLRASWGEIGNQNTSDLYPTIPGYTTPETRWINPGVDLLYTTINPAQLVSSNLTWETVQTTNIGLDASFLKNRLATSFDVYSRKTLDMLMPGAQLPEILGTPAPFGNTADLNTRGWEVELSWKDKIGDFSYGLNFNISNNETEITKYDNPAGLLGTGSRSKRYGGQINGDIWGYVTDGYYGVDDFVSGTLDAHLSGPDRQLNDGVVMRENRGNLPYPGDIKYKDLNGDGMINNGNSTLEDSGDRKIIGNTNRKYQFGLNGYATYKDFDFSFALNGVGKRDLPLNGDLIWGYQGQFDHIYKHQLDYWTPDNQDAKYPRMYGSNGVGSNYGESRQTQTKYLSNGAYLRIKNITFGYSLPQTLLSKLNVEKLRLFVAGDNLFTFDHLAKGLDPDYNNAPNDDPFTTNKGTYPIMRSFSFGLNVTF